MLYLLPSLPFFVFSFHINWIFHRKIIDNENVDPSKMMFHERVKSTDHMNKVIEMTYTIEDKFIKDPNEFKSLLEDATVL